MNVRPLPGISLALYLALLAGFVGAIEWPQSESLQNTSFAMNEQGRPLAGIRFAGSDSVRSCDNGEIIFSTTDELSPSSFSQPLGNWTAMEHDDGMISLYAHLSARHDGERRTGLEKGSILGHTGESGWQDGEGFFFAVLDRIARRWVNPVLIASLREDTTQPIIQQVLLLARDGTEVNPRTATALRQGTWRVLVETRDNENKDLPLSLGPKDIACMVNGIEVQRLQLDYLSVKDGEVLVPGNPARPAREIYTKEGLYDLGEINLKRGRTTIQINVRDAAGNERQVIYTLRVS